MTFLVSLVLIAFAHCMRVFRWELFINTYEKPNRRNLYRSLSVGYIVNTVLPLKLGDLVRMWISGNKMENGKGFSMAIIVVERCLDIIVVGMVFFLLYIFRIDMASDSLVFYIFISAVVILLIVLAFVLKGILKKALKCFASLFNEDIEFRILKFSWALIWSFKDIITRISKVKLILYTIIMWLSYLLSYSFFAEFLTLNGLSITWRGIFYMLFADNSLYIGSMASISRFSNIYTVLYFVVYIVAPLVLLFAISFIVRKREFRNDSYLKLIPHLDRHERLSFLEMYFSDNNKEYVENYLKINRHIAIIRDFSAGSNATTMLCKNDHSVFFRKYAFGSDGEKLFEQIKWIEHYANALSVTEIINYQKEDNYCYYDMPFISGTDTMFNYAHMYPIDRSWQIIEKVLNNLKNTLYNIDIRKSDQDTIRKYIASKVNNNIDLISQAHGVVGSLFGYETIVINGVPYNNLCYYKKYLNENYLLRVFSNDHYSAIHGDLTIENIIAYSSESNNKERDYYIIDPNTGNIHNSPFLDFGKLLQSVHGCYEFLMDQEDVVVSGNSITFPLKKSQVYSQLLERYNDYLYAHYSIDEVKSIYYHEIIHWLRLMPYKIKKNGDRAALFYAGMLMVMNDVEAKFEK